MGRGTHSHVERLEVRQMLTTAVGASPVAAPAGSAKLTGALIGISGSYQNQGNTIAKVFDGNVATYFDAPAGVVGWAGLDMGSPQLITQVQYVPRPGFASRMVGGVFQGSNTADFSSGVINLYSVSSPPVAGTYTAQTVTNTVAVEYVRYLAPSSGSGNVAEIEFDGAAAVVVPPVVPVIPVAPVLPAAPDAPTILSSTAVSATDANLTWAEDAGSSAVTSYTIERQGPTDVNYVVVGTTTGATTTFDDTTVAPATAYSYVVVANNTGGISLPSTVVVVTLPSPPVVIVPPVVPTPPVIGVPIVTSPKLTGTLIGTTGSYGNQGNTIANVFDGKFTTYFDAPSGNGGWAGLNLGASELITQIQYAPRSGWGSRMVGGVFQASNTADFSSSVINLYTITAAPVVNVFTIQTVTDTVGVQYVRYLSPGNAYCNVAEIEFDGTPAVVLPPPPAPDAVTIISSVAVSSTDVHFTWAEDAGSSVVTSYTIERQGPSDSNYVVIGTTAGTAFDDTSAAPNTSYSYVVLANNGGGTSAASVSVSVTLPPPPLNPWTDTNIGAVGVAGSATLNASGTITVNGSGADIWNQTDAFNYDYQPLVGNGTVLTQVTAQTNTNTWAKSGIMIRETTDADSRFVDLALTPGKGVTLQSRTATHTMPNVSILTAGKIGVWLELVRNGSSFSGYASTDGATWNLVGTVNIPMVNNVTAGMCVTSCNNTKLGTATFSNVSITPAGTEASAWSNAANSPMNRWESQSFTYNNELYVFGGFIDRSLDATTECDVFNPATNAWSMVTNMPTGALTHAATTLVGDTVYFAGGNLGNFADTTKGVCTAAVLSYDLTTGAWGSVASLPAPVSCGGMVFINNQLIYFGGLNATNTVDQSATWSLDLTNPNANWTARAAMPNARNHIGYAEINGIAYAVGGQHLYKETSGNDAEVDAYNPVTDTWSKAASLPAGRGAIHTTTMVVNNKIVIVGGQTNGGYDGIYSNNIEEYDPTVNSWTAVGTLPEANEGESVAYINGELIVANGTVDNQGGWSQDQTLIDSEILL